MLPSRALVQNGHRDSAADILRATPINTNTELSSPLTTAATQCSYNALSQLLGRTGWRLFGYEFQNEACRIIRPRGVRTTRLTFRINCARLGVQWGPRKGQSQLRRLLSNASFRRDATAASSALRTIRRNRISPFA